MHCLPRILSPLRHLSPLLLFSLTQVDAEFMLTIKDAEEKENKK